MTFQKISLAFKELILLPFQGTKGNKYFFSFLTFLAAAIMISLIYFSYRFYVQYREEKVQILFSDNLSLFNKEKNTEDQQWNTVVNAFDAGYNEAKSSYLAPYFLGYKAEALLEQDKKQEALAVYDELFEVLSSDAPLYPLYKTKQALIQLDLADEQQSKKALETLQVLSGNAQNPFRDYAQFYLGQYYWTNGQLTQAKQVWQQLVDEQMQNRISPSPWADEVKELLDTIVTVNG